MSDSHSKSRKSHEAYASKDNQVRNAPRGNSDSRFAIPNEFGIWQLTASFRFPSEMESVLCSDDLPMTVRSKIKSRNKAVSAGASADEGLLNRLTEAEARLRATFGPECFSLLTLGSRANSVEQLSPGHRRESMNLVSEVPFDWLRPILTSFSSRNIGARVFSNDYVLCANESKDGKAPNVLETAVLDIGAILADRRSHMLAQGLGFRTYVVSLPPAFLTETAVSSHIYVALPVLSFIRLPSKSYFRRTFCLSLVMVPVCEDKYGPRTLDSNELVALQLGWTLIRERGVGSYSLRDGDLSAFLSSVKDFACSPQSAQKTLTLRELIQDLLFTVARNAAIVKVSGRNEDLSSQLRDLAVRAVQVSLCGGWCSMMPDVDVCGLRRWQSNPVSEKAIEEKLNRAIARLLG